MTRMTTRLLLRVAVGGFAVALTTAAWSLCRAVRLDPLPTALPAGNDGTLAALRRPSDVPAEVLAAAIDEDPFHPERRRPATRFRFPGEALSAGDSAHGVSMAPSFILIGTAVLPEGRGFAMCQWAGDAPKLVRIGEHIGDLTLHSVAQGKAVFFTAAGKRLEVQVPKAGT